MDRALDLLLALLDCDGPAHVGAEHFDGALGDAVCAWQEPGFVSCEPGMHPCPNCPHCGEGVPYRLGGRILCPACRSTVEPRHLLLWSFDRAAFLQWLAGKLDLQGDVQCLDDRLWQLGTWRGEGGPVACFYRRPGPLSDSGRARLHAFRSTLLLHGRTRPADADGCRCLSLLELLQADRPLAVADLASLLRNRGNVRFEPHSGALWVGETWLGEVPLGSKEYAFLRCLAARLDRFVPYSDLKHAVLQEAGSSDETEEATFCQGLKSRIKKKWIPAIDKLLVTTNKADGYRLRRYAQLS